MPGKSRHGKGKHSQHSKKSKVLRRQGTPAAIPQATATTVEIPKQATSTAASPIPKAANLLPKAANMASAKTAVNPYPYITSELRRIAILAGIIIVILIILSIILS
jgi:hypothetical protein